MSNHSDGYHDHDVDGLPPPSTAAQPQIETWKNPRINIWRFCATNFAFVILGANDAVYGVSLTWAIEFITVFANRSMSRLSFPM